MALLTKTKTMPVFWPKAARAQLGDERYEAALAEPLSVDLLTWNIFQSLERHSDQEWLAYRLQQFGGTDLHAPVRIQLWSGLDADAQLRPSRAYLQAARERVAAAGGEDTGMKGLQEPIEVAVRIESPRVLCLVHTVMDKVDRGPAGSDKLVTLIDAGLEHARWQSKDLAVAVVYRAGSAAASELSTRINELRRTLPRELPHQKGTGRIQLREVSWQQLIRVWESEVGYLDVPGSRRAFVDYLKRHDLY